jgi:hypothetical protein
MTKMQFAVPTTYSISALEQEFTAGMLFLQAALEDLAEK